MENKNITGKGTFYCVGVGAGEGSYISLGALRAMEKSDIIAIPVKAAGEQSTAFETVKTEFETGKKEIMELIFPMTKDKEKLLRAWERNKGKIIAALRQNKSVAMITLGDASLYSTCSYMVKAVRNNGYRAETMPGIPSFCAAAAKAGISLAMDDEAVAVMPAGRLEVLEDILPKFDTVVIMKAGGDINRIYEILEKHNLHRNALVCGNIGMEGEIIAPIKEDGRYGYFTTVIVRKGDRI